MITYNYQAFVHRYSTAIRLNQYNSKRIFIVKRACLLLNRFSEYEQYRTIQDWSLEFKVSVSALKSYVQGKDSEPLSHTEKLREFLHTFVIKENEITREIDIERDGIKYTRDELTILAEDEGIRAYNMDKLLKTSNKNITVVKVFNPLQRMFEELADNYRGEPLIHQLASCIKSYDHGDNNNGFYQERLEYYFHKWLCKAAGQVLHVSTNDVMLLWIEPIGGSGKSYLNEWLFSLPKIQEYYIRISENEAFMDMKGISRAKFAIDFDELPLTKKRYLAFKSHIAASGGQVYNKDTKTYQQYQRQVNFIGSTNKANRNRQKGYLLDDDSAMMRRIAPIEIEGQINYQKYTKDIDLEQLWGQAACDIIQAKESGNQHLLTWECDYDDMRHQNRRYINFNTLEEKAAIRNVLVPGAPGDGNLISSRQIISKLVGRGIKVYMNEWEMGQFLARHGYTHGRNKNLRGWWIKL